MPRRPRLSSAGFVFHALNRGVGRASLFPKEADYAAFEKILRQAHSVTAPSATRPSQIQEIKPLVPATTALVRPMGLEPRWLEPFAPRSRRCPNADRSYPLLGLRGVAATVPDYAGQQAEVPPGNESVSRNQSGEIGRMAITSWLPYSWEMSIFALPVPPGGPKIRCRGCLGGGNATNPTPQAFPRKVSKCLLCAGQSPANQGRELRPCGNLAMLLGKCMVHKGLVSGQALRIWQCYSPILAM
jgi:hypothetical protein